MKSDFLHFAKALAESVGTHPNIFSTYDSKDGRVDKAKEAVFSYAKEMGIAMETSCSWEPRLIENEIRDKAGKLLSSYAANFGLERQPLGSIATKLYDKTLEMLVEGAEKTGLSTKYVCCGSQTYMPKNPPAFSKRIFGRVLKKEADSVWQKMQEMKPEEIKEVVLVKPVRHMGGISVWSKIEIKSDFQKPTNQLKIDNF
jgi:hypothetical protein